MQSSIATYARCALGLALAAMLTAQQAAAASISLPVVLEGQAGNLVIEYANSTNIGEDQFGSIKESNYTLTISHIIFDQGPIYFDEFSGPLNARVLSVSQPEGSYVGLTWDFSWNCHEGCSAKGKFALELNSPTSDLYFNSAQLPADFLKTGHPGTGAILLNFFRSRSLEIVMPTDTSLAKFTVAVPETGTWPLAIGGLTMVGMIMRVRQRKTGSTPVAIHSMA